MMLVVLSFATQVQNSCWKRRVWGPDGGTIENLEEEGKKKKDDKEKKERQKKKKPSLTVRVTVRSDGSGHVVGIVGKESILRTQWFYFGDKHRTFSEVCYVHGDIVRGAWAREMGVGALFKHWKGERSTSGGPTHRKNSAALVLRYFRRWPRRLPCHRGFRHGSYTRVTISCLRTDPSARWTQQQNGAFCKVWLYSGHFVMPGNVWDKA